MTPFLPLAAVLTVPSPLAGEGQGEGCHTTRSLGWAAKLTFLSHTLPVALPLSPALPRKGGGSALPMPHDDRVKGTQVERFA